MSLVNALLNGGAVGAAEVDVTRYGHSSAPRIAMESAAELHEIFMESFYNVEQAELAAATEGVVLEGSQYEAVAENAIKNAATKIKTFLEKLWAKVKAFFHNIKRYLDSIFMSGHEFVKKYEADIIELKKGNLEDYTVKMYDYDDSAIDTVDQVNVEEKAKEILKTYGYDMDNAADRAVYNAKNSGGRVYTDDRVKTTEDNFSTEKVKQKFVSSLGCKDPDEFETWCFAKFRNGAESADDKEDIDIHSVDKYVNVLKNSSKLLKNVSDAEKNTNDAYSKALKVIKECESALDKVKDSKDATNLSKMMRIYSSAISTCQSTNNVLFNSWKAVIKERDAAYKQVIVGAFSNAKKTAKKKKDE